MTHTSRECYLCHRIGTRAFVPYGDWAWRCYHEGACRRRQEERHAQWVRKTWRHDDLCAPQTRRLGESRPWGRMHTRRPKEIYL